MVDQSEYMCRLLVFLRYKSYPLSKVRELVDDEIMEPSVSSTKKGLLSNAVRPHIGLIAKDECVWGGGLFLLPCSFCVCK